MMANKKKITRKVSLNITCINNFTCYGIKVCTKSGVVLNNLLGKQLFSLKSSLFVIFLTNFIFLQTSAQKITLDKAQYLLGDTIKINITPDGEGTDKQESIIDLSKLKNMVYERDTNTYEAFADVELLVIQNDTLVKDNKIIFNNHTTMDLQLRIYSLGVFKLLQNENDSTYIVIDDLDSLNVQSDIKDILPIFEDESFDWKWLYFLLGGLVLLLAGYYFMKCRKRFLSKKSEQPATVKEQYLLTLEALEKIKNRNWALEEAKIFQSELTEVLRKYIEHYFDKNAMSLTSDELIQSLNLKISRPDLLNNLSELFSIADLVKFAKASPEISLFSEAADKAIQFVKETRIEKES